MTNCCLFCLLVLVSCKISLNLTCKTGTKTNNTFRKFFKNFIIYSRLIIKSVYKPFRYNSTKILVTCIIFRKQNKVIVSVLTCICLFIETGARSHINFTANNWFNIISQCSSVKINRPIHNSMVCYGKAIHTKLFCSFCYFFYFT